MNILPRRRGERNFIIEAIADHSRAIRDVFHYLEAGLRCRPYLDRFDIDMITVMVAETRARLDRVEAEIGSPVSRSRLPNPQRGTPVPGGIVDHGDELPANAVPGTPPAAPSIAT